MGTLWCDCEQRTRIDPLRQRRVGGCGWPRVHLVRKPVAVAQTQVGSESPVFTVQMHQTNHSSDYEHSARQRLQKRWTLTQAQLSPTRTESRRYQHRTACSDQSHRTHRSSAPRPKLLQTPLFTDALGRRPALASPSATRRAKQMLALVAERRGECCLTGPMLPSRHRCNCRANRPTAGEAPPSHSTHRDAPGVKAHERAAAAMPRA